MLISCLLTELQRREMKTILGEISQKISKKLRVKSEKHGLLDGLAGQILFIYNVYKSGYAHVNKDLLSEKMDHLQEQLNTQSLELSSGLAGQAWLLEYLNQSDKAEYDSEIFESVDILFANALSQQGVWVSELETTLGVAGYSAYTSRRAKFTDQTQLYSIIVAAFERSATYFDNGCISWPQPSNSVFRINKKDKNFPEYNLGLAHGVPGIIAALIPALAISKLKIKTHKLLVGSCDWLLKNQNSFEKRACFGNYVGDDGNSRLGWCYGDLTIALTVMRAGKALNKPYYIEKALKIACKAAKRDENSGYVKDAGICHGYFGLIIIFSLLNKLSPHPDLQKAVDYWVSYALDKYRENGIKSFYSYKGSKDGYQEDFSFLMGYSGIGLVIVSLLTGEQDWTDCLLVS